MLPVMVFFHGGGFQCGSGIRPFYGPDHLLDHDIIYVGANFRLGPLGFLSTESEDCPGNFGLKDQVLVLKWIQQNIEAFGGDPKRYVRQATQSKRLPNFVQVHNSNDV